MDIKLLVACAHIALCLVIMPTYANASETQRPETAHEPQPGEREVRAMARAYPGRIDRFEYRDGDWALSMDGRWFYWAEGRLLPVEHREDFLQFVGVRFYNYDLGPFEGREITPELEERLRNRMQSFSDDGRLRFNDFLDTLYGISSEADAERTMRRIQFFGRSTRVHPLVVGPLERVEQRIRNVMLHDGTVRAFVRDLSQIHGYNWRNIAGTPRRSYHSYGIAVDIMPRSFNRRHAYWRWAVDSGVEDWWNLSEEQRWQVPQPIIDAFESEGFIWGGKWLSFDNIHFEYRPEVIHLSR